METKFCEFCGNKVAVDAVVCTKCGKQIEELKTESNKSTPQVIINNTNNNSNTTMTPIGTKKCDKWVSLLLCIFLGIFGAHKFYEGKGGLGIVYFFTGGLFFIGVFIDFFAILSKPNPYYV